MTQLYLPGRYVVSGGPGFGKTTLVQALKREGFYTGEEIARQVIIGLKERGEIDKLPQASRAKFEEVLLPEKINDYLKAPENRVSFFDRGFPDAIAFFREENIKPLLQCFQACRDYEYDGVFLVPPWEEIYKKDSERKHSFEKAVRVHKEIETVYGDFGYPSFEVPIGSIEERVLFVKSNLKKSKS